MIECFFLGVCLGYFYHAGLWWTVQRGLTSENPALWFAGSFLLRSGLLMLGFGLLTQGDWRRAGLALLGFQLARIGAVRREN